MQRNSYFSRLWIAILALTVAGCGGSSSGSSQAPLTGLSKRVLVSNSENGTVSFVDAKKDQLNAKTLAAPSATKMLTAGGTTIAMDSAGSQITIIDNATEAVTFNAAIGDQPFDIAISPDGKTAWAAMRNFGFVQAVSTTTGLANPVFRIGNARRLVMSPTGTKLLVFPDPQAQTAPNTHTFFVLDTTTGFLQTITDPVHLDQPFTAVFGTSDTQAFILNCGAECGGTTASVVSVDFTGGAQNFGNNLQVAGATVASLSGTTLYVAGTPPASSTFPVAACPLSRCGQLTVVNVSSAGAPSAGAPIPITDGLHETMALTTTGRVYIGATGCSVEPGAAPTTIRGCLTIFNITSSTTIFPTESSFRQNFNVTGLVPITGRNAIYVVQAGALDIFDTSTDALETGITAIDIIGNAQDAVLLDP
jgi:hypothetical protein